MTKRQREVLDAIAAFATERGYQPTVRNLCERLNLTSSSTIHSHLESLRRKGYVTWEPGEPRTLRVLRHPESEAS